MNLDITKLIPYEKNPRNNNLAVDIVAKSIKEFGFTNPILVDENNVILAGHTRLLAAFKLEYEEVPVKVIEGLTEAQKKAYRIMDNRSGEFSKWADELLIEEIEELKSLDFNIDLTGFDEMDIDSLMLDQKDIEEVDMPILSDGDKKPFQQKTFTLHDEQALIVDDAITLARTNPLCDTGINDNSNGNALALICEQWLNKKHA